MDSRRGDTNVASLEFTWLVRCVSFLTVFSFMTAFLLALPF